MRPKVGAFLAILCVDAMTPTVRQYRFQSIVVAPRQVWPFIDDQTADELALCMMHDARLAKVHIEPLVQGDRGGECRKLLDATSECCVTRKSQIVCIAAVLGTNRRGCARQTPIEPKGAQVGQRRRCRRSLRQV